MTKQWTDLDTWMCDNANERVFRVWRYKKIFTPREMDAKYVDQSPYEDDTAQLMWLDEVIELGGGRFMFGFRDAEWAAQYDNGDISSPAPIEYFMDGEFVMQYFEDDYKRLLDDLGYGDDADVENDEEGTNE